MFAKVYQFEFAELPRAKAAAAKLSRELSTAISEYDLAGLSIFLNKSGTVTVHVKFDELDLVKEFEADKGKLVLDITNEFSCTSNETTALALFAYEREAVSTEISA